MARLFPLRSETPAREGTPRIVDLEDEDADAVFSALSSTTARQIYTRLSNEPGTPSDVAESIDSSIQNVRYHLENLEEAGLVEVVDTWYSSRGNEMSVYATTDGPLIVTSDESRASQLKDAISRFIGGVTVLAGASLLVQAAVERFFSPDSGTGFFAGGGADDAGAAGGADDGGGAGGDGGDSGDGADGADGDSADIDSQSRDRAEDESDAEGLDDGGEVTVEEDAAEGEQVEGDDAGDGADGGDGGDGADDAAVDREDDAGDLGAEDLDSQEETTANDTYDGATESPDGGATDGGTETPDTVTTAADGAVESTDAFVSTIPPGALFFLGGLVVLSVVTIWWYWSYR